MERNMNWQKKKMESKPTVYAKDGKVKTKQRQL
jgi:hypothetical protein